MLQCSNVQMLQMVQVHRSGSVVSIPRKLSHHVPIVPILESQDYDRKGSIYFSSALKGQVHLGQGAVGLRVGWSMA